MFGFLENSERMARNKCANMKILFWMLDVEDFVLTVSKSCAWLGSVDVLMFEIPFEGKSDFIVLISRPYGI